MLLTECSRQWNAVIWVTMSVSMIGTSCDFAKAQTVCQDQNGNCVALPVRPLEKPEDGHNSNRPGNLHRNAERAREALRPDPFGSCNAQPVIRDRTAIRTQPQC